jgi:hypothetical protein
MAENMRAAREKMEKGMGKCLQPGFPIWAAVFNCRLLLFTFERLFSPPTPRLRNPRRISGFAFQSGIRGSMGV